MSVKFEKVSRFKDIDLPLPQRKTVDSAGYDFIVAEDTIVPSYSGLVHLLTLSDPNGYQFDYTDVFNAFFDPDRVRDKLPQPKTLDEVAEIVKKSKAKPTLVSTGMKCYLDPGTYLELSVRSSCPLKNWLILANGVGVIDRDYVDNQSNEGEIFFQMINLSPFDIQLQRGDRIGQGIIKPYLTTDDDAPGGIRTGGFGSTGG